MSGSLNRLIFARLTFVAALVAMIFGFRNFVLRDRPVAGAEGAAGLETGAPGEDISEKALRAGRRFSSQELDDMRNRVRAAYPELNQERRRVNDEDNRALQLLNLLDQAHLLSPAGEPPEIDAARLDGARWDAAKAKQWVEANAELLDRLMEIANLPDSSLSGLSRDRALNFDMKGYRLVNHLLGASVRVSLDQGDIAGACQTLSAIRRLGHSLSDGEGSFFLSHAMGESLESSGSMLGWSRSLENGDLDRNSLSQLRAALAPEASSNDRLVQVIRGECYSLMDTLTVRELNDQGGDPEAMLHAIARLGAARVRQAEQGDPMLLLTKAAPEGFQVDAGLTASQREIVMKMNESYTVFGSSIVFVQASQAMKDAAIAVALGETPPVDSLTGKPYQIDREKGVLRFPDEAVSIEVPIPTVKKETP